ncbi:MAG: rhomboid family intramembrane serine protease [Pseudomonadota bacterium]
MADYVTALRVPADENLLPLSRLLQQRRIPHRIFEQSGEQVVAVASRESAAQVEVLYGALRRGEVEHEYKPPETTPTPALSSASWHRAPVVLILVVLSVLGFATVALPPLSGAVHWFTFLPFEVVGNQLRMYPMGDQYWRLVTPAFLHFGWLHIVFNCLWLWELGRRVESVIGHFNCLMLCLVIAVVSNVSQYQFGGDGLFGGMSGVVYGLLGFSWVAPLLQPRWPIQPSAPIMLFMVGWLLACLFGLVETLGFGKVANAAHVGGLLCGGLLGAIFGLLSRSSGDIGSAGRV